eukprot:Em0004g371a
MSVRKDLDSVIQYASLALGYPQLRSKQYDAVKSFLEGNDVFVVLPTGSGKSLCYSLLPLAFNTLLGRESSIVIVISPLKALMKDQVASLSSKDVVAAYVDVDTLPDKEKIKRVHSGQFSLLFISPELLLLNLAFREMLRTPTYMNNIVAFVIDEAHCVTKWGNHFRREFTNLGEVRSLIPNHVHVMALTATATERTIARVSAILGLVAPKIITVSPDKSNIC